MKTPQTEAAKAIARVAVLAILAALVVFGVYRGYRWIYDRGVSAERAVWTAAQAEADRKQREREEAAQAAGETISDTTRQETAAAVGQVATDTQESIERIQYVYLQDPNAATSCRPDGGPAAIPASVQDELRQAERAAESAARGL